MRILVACELPDFAINELRSLGSDFAYEPRLRPDALAGAIPDVAILIVGALRVAPEVIQRGKALQMIVHAGSGAPNIALDEASAQGIFVMHCPGRDAAALAELAFGLIVALDRRVVEHTITLREGRWNRAELLDARGLAGRSLGVLGWCAAGAEVARRARAFGMHVAAWSPTMTPEQLEAHGVECCAWPRELARRCDIVTVHAPRALDRQVVVDEEFLENMRAGAYLIHLGHPGALDEAAVARAVQQRQLRVALDVYVSEPAGDVGKFRSPLLQLPGVIGTQHVGGVTEQVRDSVAAEVVRIVRTFLVSGELLNCLNIAERSPATWQLVLRVRDQVGVMAAILEAVRADGINAEEISSRVFTGAKAAWCTIALDERPSNEALDAIRALPDVLHLELRAVV